MNVLAQEESVLHFWGYGGVGLLLGLKQQSISLLLKIKTSTCNNVDSMTSSSFSDSVLVIFLGGLLAMLTYAILMGEGERLGTGIRDILGLMPSREEYLRLDQHVKNSLQYPPPMVPNGSIGVSGRSV